MGGYKNYKISCLVSTGQLSSETVPAILFGGQYRNTDLSGWQGTPNKGKFTAKYLRNKKEIKMPKIN